jgi:hypothetical protein
MKMHEHIEEAVRLAIDAITRADATAWLPTPDTPYLLQKIERCTMTFPPTPALGILDAPGRASRAAAVRRALGHEQAEVLDWSARPIGYVELSPVSGGLYRVSGLARLPSVTVDKATPWSLVLKIARSPAGGAFADGSPIPPDGASSDSTRNTGSARCWRTSLVCWATYPAGWSRLGASGCWMCPW